MFGTYVCKMQVIASFVTEFGHLYAFLGNGFYKRICLEPKLNTKRYVPLLYNAYGRIQSKTYIKENVE